MLELENIFKFIVYINGGINWNNMNYYKFGSQSKRNYDVSTVQHNNIIIINLL